VFSWACSETLMCCTVIALRQAQHTLWGNIMTLTLPVFSSTSLLYALTHTIIRNIWYLHAYLLLLSQRSLHNAPIFRLLLKVAVNGTHQCDFLNFCGDLGPQHANNMTNLRSFVVGTLTHPCAHCQYDVSGLWGKWTILAEGAIALSVTLSGGALFASWKLLQFPSSLIVKVILAIFMGASAQH